MRLLTSLIRAFTSSKRSFTSSKRALMPLAMIAMNPTMTVTTAIPVPMTETTMVLVSVTGSSRYHGSEVVEACA